MKLPNRHRSLARTGLAAMMAMAVIVQAGCGSTPAATTAATTAAATAAASSAAAGETTAAATDDIAFPVQAGTVTMKYWVPMSTTAIELIKTWNDTLSMQELEAKTGVHIEFIHPPAGQETQNFNLMLASGDLPDMIQEQENPLRYPGGGDKAIADGIYLNLNDLISKYAPNYQKAMNMNDTTMKMTVTDSGNRWGFFHITPDTEPAWHGYVVRKDWLDELGLQTPVTLEDWHTVLTAFKEKKGAESPLLINNTGVPLFGHIVSAFGVIADFYQQDGKVLYGPMQAGYKEYLTLMKQWYSEGLVDKDFMGRQDPGFAYLAPANLAATDKTGMFHTVWGYTADSYVTSGTVKDNPNFYLQGIQAPKKTADQEITFNLPSYQVRSGTAITSACKTPEIAAKWLDYQYTEEGSNIISYGKEGTSYNLVDGKPVFTDMILKPDASAGLSASNVLHKYVRWDGPGIVQYRRMYASYEAGGNADVMEAFMTWDKDKPTSNLPKTTLTSDEATENSNIMPDITTYVNEMTIKFIIGTEPIENFDAFASQIQSMNIDRAIAIQQAALDRYNARK